MNKNKLYRIIIFLLLLIIIDRLAGFCMTHYSLKYKFDKRIELLISNLLDKDIIILGSSRALNGIDPKTIENETKMSCYNLGYSGSNVEFHETILNLILKSDNHPKIIIYNIDDPATLVDFGDLVIYKKEELYPYVYNDYINEIISDKLDKSVVVSKISKTYHNNVNFINTIKYLRNGEEKPNYEINNVDIYEANLMSGHQTGFEHMVMNKRVLNYKIESEYLPYVNSFKNIVSKCDEYKINLMLVISPSFLSANKGFKERINTLTEGKISVYDYSEAFQDKELFYNHGHLNKDGAIKFSKLLSKNINE